jgi:hypothetical protein
MLVQVSKKLLYLGGQVDAEYMHWDKRITAEFRKTFPLWTRVFP